ncbi:MAG: hypothetical protein HFE76_08180 [Firmicutes bacterium]|nr:hypothetical protein [Bacillota bacterium]
MNKQDLIRDMTKFAGNRPFITKTKLGRFLGRQDTYARHLVQGLDKIPGEVKGDKYYIPDVVERILQERRV